MKELPSQGHFEKTQDFKDIAVSVDDLLENLPAGANSFELKIYMWANEHGKLVKVPISQGDVVRIMVERVEKQ